MLSIEPVFGPAFFYESKLLFSSLTGPCLK